MLDYTEVIEMSKAYEFVKQDVLSGRVSHAYLFFNGDENYLLKFCESVATILINSSAKKDDIDKNSLRVKSHTHPDVMIYGLDNQISVDTISEIVDQSSYKPFEADKKIFVILNFQDVSEICQNKILKTIEEPPENTYFLIATSSLSRILTTILSRVKVFNLDNPTTLQIQNLLEKEGVGKESAEIFASCSDGNISLAEKLVDDENFIEFFNQVVLCLFEINGSRDVIKWSNVFSSKQVDKDEFLDIMSIILRDVMLLKGGAENLINNVNIKSKLNLIGQSLNEKSITILMREILKAKEKINFNVNQTAIVDEILFKIAEVKVKCKRLSE